MGNALQGCGFCFILKVYMAMILQGVEKGTV